MLVVLDTVRADHLSAYGYYRRTSPNFDRLAAQGSLFLNAYAGSSWSLPSHASMFTGLLPHEHGADPVPLAAHHTTLAERLAARGYATGSFVANTIWCTRAAGLAQGFARHEDYFGNAWDGISRTVYAQKLLDAALRTAGNRCVEIAERFGDDVFYSAMDAMLERNKRAMRELIRRTVPEQKQHFEDYICDDGLNMGPYKIACTMWRDSAVG